ncbi:J domain-containing protein [Amedibacillus sp. YH-ame10]
MKDAWELLGIAPTENKRAIKKAYAKMLAKYHPEEYPEEFIEIQNAYQSIMNSLERDYKKPESLSSDLAEGFHKKDTIYLKTPFVEQDTRSDFDTELPQQDIFPDLDIEIIHEEQPKQEDESIYDDFDLSWSFQNQDNKLKKEHAISDLDIEIIHGEKPKQEGQTFYDNPNIPVNQNTKSKKEYVKEVYKQEDIEVKQNSEEQNLKEYLYLRFAERIKFSCRADVMKDLILNQTFFDAIGDEQFYIKISALIRTNYARFDSISRSFLYDAFSYIETSFNYSNTDEKSITRFIAAEKLRVEKEKARKQRAEKRNGIILLACLFLFIFVFMYISKMQKDKEKIKQEQAREIIRDTIIRQEEEKEEIKEAMQQNKATLEAHMLETYKSAYTCTLYDLSYKPNSFIFFYCNEEQNVENKKNGRVKLGEDRLITEINAFDVIITTEE